MVDENLAFTPASELAELIANKQVSPVEIAQLYFDRIERLDSQLNSYLTLTQDEAMRVAKNAEEAVIRGDELGPLHGVPISIKDLQMTRGVRTTAPSKLAAASRISSSRTRARGSVTLPRRARLGRRSRHRRG